LLPEVFEMFTQLDRRLEKSQGGLLAFLRFMSDRICDGAPVIGVLVSGAEAPSRDRISYNALGTSVANTAACFARAAKAPVVST
jgi:hypothetical protein